MNSNNTDKDIKFSFFTSADDNDNDKDKTANGDVVIIDYSSELEYYWKQTKRPDTYEDTVFHSINCGCCSKLPPHVIHKQHHKPKFKVKDTEAEVKSRSELKPELQIKIYNRTKELRAATNRHIGKLSQVETDLVTGVIQK